MTRTLSLFSITLRRTTTVIMVIATSMWFKAAFVTSIGVPPSQIGMLSTLKAPLPNNNCLQLRLSSSATTVWWFLGLEASRALIYNDLIHRQPPWYLQIPPPRVTGKHTIQTELQVRDKFWYTFEIGTHKLSVYARRAFWVWSSRHSRITARGNGSIGA